MSICSSNYEHTYWSLNGSTERKIFLNHIKHFWYISLLQLTEKLTAAESFKDRVSIAANHLMASWLFPNVNDLEKAASSFYKRLLIAERYSLNHNLQSPVHLLKAEDSKLQSTDSDYGLSQVSHFLNIILISEIYQLILLRIFYHINI